uniref:Protein phosphatase 1 regulatory subunit 1A n=1 Tax=Gopherus evgoodei TaxID=1825980 RepID=A0A8C4YB45_9SAUR
KNQDSELEPPAMEPNSPRKIQFTVPLLEPHLDPEAAEQVGPERTPRSSPHSAAAPGSPRAGLSSARVSPERRVTPRGAAPGPARPGSAQWPVRCAGPGSGNAWGSSLSRASPVLLDSAMGQRPAQRSGIWLAQGQGLE